MRVKVTPVVPRLLTLVAPAKLGVTARTLALKLAASVPSRLTVKGGRATKRAPLGRRVRTVSVRVKPGKAALKLTLLLKGGGKRATVPLLVLRG